MKTGTRTRAATTADRSIAVWEEYRRSGNRSLRNRLVLTYVPLVKHVVYKKLRELPVSCEADELISCGIEGLIAALDQYDPRKGAGLEPYLWTRIHGAVLDELRRRDWAPRSLRRLERDIRKAREQFTGAHGRPPTRQELADLVSLTPRELRDREREIENSDMTSLSSLVVGEGETAVELVDTLETDDETTDPEHMAEVQHTKSRFRRAFAQLSEREQEVAVLLYVKNLTLREIGEVLGVSESRVSQIHGQLKRRVRDRLAEDPSLFAEVA
ncbi:MAG TPA: FliA/WhiG family RNA polymerase sigma factor [Thermoleophilaceae bacterium]|nr:FliA/WhiG family RNA polymerase sigma factor [Thermoleophilaceae bacterium]